MSQLGQGPVESLSKTSAVAWPSIFFLAWDCQSVLIGLFFVRSRVTFRICNGCRGSTGCDGRLGSFHSSAVSEPHIEPFYGAFTPVNQERERGGGNPEQKKINESNPNKK